MQEAGAYRSDGQRVRATLGWAYSGIISVPSEPVLTAKIVASVRPIDQAESFSAHKTGSTDLAPRLWVGHRWSAPLGPDKSTPSATDSAVAPVPVSMEMLGFPE